MISIDHAQVYDVETYPNAITIRTESLFDNTQSVWQISEFVDQRQQFFEWFDYVSRANIPKIGFNNVYFDYQVVHYIFMNPTASVKQIYDYAMSLINSISKFGNTIWANDRLVPQIDTFQINHFHNKAKSTSLKALQINMRCQSVQDLPIPVGTYLTQQQIEEVLIPYNGHDVHTTKQFALINLEAIRFRISLIEQFGIDVLNWPDSKIGTNMMESMLGKELCYDFSTGKKKRRQSPRSLINIGEVIFPYVKFENPELIRIKSYLEQQILKATDIKIVDDGYEINNKIKTKGVFAGLKANVGGVEFHYGVGGIHGSLNRKKIISTEEWLIRDIDVASLYPSIAIVNNLAPEHLGETFSKVYAELPKTRKKWQKEKGKKCVEANSYKLAGNTVYGNSNNEYSVFYDPKYMVTITVNGQLLLSMLAEWLLKVPTIKLIQINTDGITYFIHRDYEPQAVEICKQWENYTKLVLEDADYNRMWIRDVNNYIAEDKQGNLKLKGAYWTPDPLNYHESISQAQPPAWHKDLGNVVSVRAAVAHMVDGASIEDYIRLNTNPYDFMCRIKVKRADNLLYGGQQVQKTSRYYVSVNGCEMVKESPPTGTPGAYKKAAKVTEEEYNRVMLETGGQWDERVCTKNKSVHETRYSKIQAGHKVSLCNNVEEFNFNNVNYDWYINQAKELVID